MISQIINITLKILKYLKSWKLVIGKNPGHVLPNAVILFPAFSDRFFCGLTGILTVKKKRFVEEGDIIKKLLRIFEKARVNNLKSLEDNKISRKDYLGGGDVLETMEGNIHKLKQDSLMEDIFFEAEKRKELKSLCRKMNSFLEKEEKLVEKRASHFSTADMEYVNNDLIRFKDFVWGLEKDVLSNIEKINFLSGAKGKMELSKEAFRRYRNINFLLSSLDRLEVRGRDSAGIQMNLEFEGKDSLDRVVRIIRDNGLYDSWVERVKPGDLMDGCIHVSHGAGEDGRVSISFTYKKASVTGKLGENGRYLRDRIRSDGLFHAVAGEAVESEIYLGHTRWASVGSITEENCHPVNNYTIDAGDEDWKEYPFYGKGAWSINVVLNGDVDNYSLLRGETEPEGEDLIDKGITTDTKIIPLRIERYLFDGHDLTEAFRLALNDFEGSHAVAMESNLEPGKVFLALRGSGQSLYVGLCDNQYMFSSELYGLVELTPSFIKMDGETERIEGNPRTKGQIFVLSRD
ncbi:MAG: hypothetical protein KAT81_03255, partial [Syntrophobacterales bacterium]|nr:hypothetical protein [Syntrophobacterales bacterium]